MTSKSIIDLINGNLPKKQKYGIAMLQYLARKGKVPVHSSLLPRSTMRNGLITTTAASFHVGGGNSECCQR